MQAEEFWAPRAVELYTVRSHNTPPLTFCSISPSDRGRTRGKIKRSDGNRAGGRSQLNFYRHQRGSDRIPDPRHTAVAGNPRERLFLEDDDLNRNYHEEQAFDDVTANWVGIEGDFEAEDG